MEAGVRILLDVLAVLVAAKLGGELAERLRQPPVLGELLAGVLLGASLLGGAIGLPDLNASGLDGAGEVLSFLAGLGAILLLFGVGLESDVQGLRRVGASSLGVAAIGMAASFALGYAASSALGRVWPAWHVGGDLPPYLLHAFVGATLTATSVGITARVLGDLRRLQSPEARVILGAAVLDDVGGLLVLAVITAVVGSVGGGAGVDAAGLLWIAAKAVGFLGLSLVAGLYAVPRAFDFLAAHARVRGAPVALAVAFALGMACLGALAGLAPIVGAFAAGLLLARARHAQALRQDLEPVAALLVAVYFATLGMRADLGRIEGHGQAVLGVGLLLAVVAVAAKLASGLGVVRGQAKRLAVGVGMVPRGEVGLLFAAQGLSTTLISPWQYTTLVLVVLLTTFISPLWLRRLGDGFTGAPDRDPDPRRDVGEPA